MVVLKRKGKTPQKKNKKDSGGGETFSLRSKKRKSIKRSKETREKKKNSNDG